MISNYLFNINGDINKNHNYFILIQISFISNYGQMHSIKMNLNLIHYIKFI